jgi:hypothetical protein
MTDRNFTPGRTAFRSSVNGAVKFPFSPPYLSPVQVYLWFACVLARILNRYPLTQRIPRTQAVPIRVCIVKVSHVTLPAVVRAGFGYWVQLRHCARLVSPRGDRGSAVSLPGPVPF